MSIMFMKRSSNIKALFTATQHLKEAVIYGLSFRLNFRAEPFGNTQAADRPKLNNPATNQPSNTNHRASIKLTLSSYQTASCLSQHISGNLFACFISFRSSGSILARVRSAPPISTMPVSIVQSWIWEFSRESIVWKCWWPWLLGRSQNKQSGLARGSRF